MTPVNRRFMLSGLPGLRGVCDIRTIDFPDSEQAQARRGLRAGQGDVRHAQPSRILHRLDDRQGDFGAAFPEAAFWATNGVVNGLGRLAQKFWLANNLIAQIPGNSEPAREHSIDWALKGKGVLLHAEGAVGWHCNYVAPLMPGAVEMAVEALRRGRETDPAFEAFVAPVVWKLVFQRDVEPELLPECAYVEGRLKIEPGEGLALPARVYRLYETCWTRRSRARASTTRRHGLSPSGTPRWCRRSAYAARRTARARHASDGTVRSAAPRAPLAAREQDRSGAPRIKVEIDRLALNLRLGAVRLHWPDGDAGGTGRAHQAHPQRLLQRHDARHAEPLRAAAGWSANGNHPRAGAARGARVRWDDRGGAGAAAQTDAGGAGWDQRGVVRGWSPEDIPKSVRSELKPHNAGPDLCSQTFEQSAMNDYVCLPKG